MEKVWVVYFEYLYHLNTTFKGEIIRHRPPHVYGHDPDTKFSYYFKELVTFHHMSFEN